MHLTHVGVGWALARLPFARRRLTRRLDPTLTPLAFDGWGFHNGYFRGAAATRERLPVRGEARHVYDQGLGRSLWFSCGADPYRIGAAVSRLPDERHADLWAGVGMACVYAGGSDASGIDEQTRLCGRHMRWLRHGKIPCSSIGGISATNGGIPERGGRTFARTLREKVQFPCKYPWIRQNSLETGSLWTARRTTGPVHADARVAASARWPRWPPASLRTACSWRV
jgi:hypothetical protein